MPKGVYKHKSGFKRSEECKRRLSEQKLGFRNPMFGKRGEKHHLWKGGKTTNGIYVLVYTPHHPYGRKNGYVYEHRLVVEKIIKRFLKSYEEVHHIDLNKRNNVPKNLMAFRSKRAHRLFERGIGLFRTDIVFDGRKLS